jgi:transposase-like protein
MLVEHSGARLMFRPPNARREGRASVVRPRAARGRARYRRQQQRRRARKALAPVLSRQSHRRPDQYCFHVDQFSRSRRAAHCKELSQPRVQRIRRLVAHARQVRANNRAENFRQPTRESKRRMRRFKSPAQRFLAAFGVIASFFRPRRHLLPARNDREVMRRRFTHFRVSTSNI